MVMQDAGKVIYLRYPRQCCGTVFDASYEVARSHMAARVDTPYAIVHDLSSADVFTIQLEAVVRDATAIAQSGMVMRVAFVLQVHPLTAAAIAVMAMLKRSWGNSLIR